MEKRHINFILILVFLISSCEKPIDFTQEVKTPKLVVNSFFNPDSTWSVYLSHSLTIISPGALEPVNNATINLFENNELIGNFQLVRNGKYVSDIKPVENQAYSIEAEAPGYKKVSAKSEAPNESIEVLAIDTSRVDRFDEELLKFKIKVKDIGSELHYYGITLIGQIEGYWNPIYFYSNDPILNVPTDGTISAAFTNELFTNTTATIELSANVIMYDGSGFFYDKLIFVLSTYSKDAYLYNRSYELYNIALDDFFAEPVQVYNNIENGFGIFSGYRSLEYEMDLQ
jgi:hypothetical protein